MEKWMSSSGSTILMITVSAIGIYTAVILFTRLFGKRSFSKMSSFDFASTIAIGSIIASTILTSSVSLLEGCAGLFIIYLMQSLVAFFRRYGLFRNLVDNRPILLMEGEQILKGNLKKARVTEDDLRAKLREANVIEMSEVKAVIFESTGDIAVLHTSDKSKNVASWLLKGVKR